MFGVIWMYCVSDYPWVKSSFQVISLIKNLTTRFDLINTWSEIQKIKILTYQAYLLVYVQNSYRFLLKSSTDSLQFFYLSGIKQIIQSRKAKWCNRGISRGYSNKPTSIYGYTVLAFSQPSIWIKWCFTQKLMSGIVVKIRRLFAAESSLPRLPLYQYCYKKSLVWELIFDFIVFSFYRPILLVKDWMETT